MHLYGMTEPENRTIRVNAMHVTDAQELAKQRPIDIAFIAVKSYDTVWATRLIRQYLAPGGFVVSSQNCINEERIAGVVGWGRTVGCVVGGGVGVELFEPGHVRRSMMKNPNVVSFHVGEPHGRISRRVEELAEMLDGIDNAHATDNLWGERWTKLCVNGMRNGVSAATGLGGNARDSHDAIRRICIRLGGESVRVGQALGFTLGKIGALEPEKLALASEGNRGALEEIEALMLAGTNAAGAQRPAAAIDGAGHGEGPPHRDRVHERLHRGEGRRGRRAGADACDADRGGEARRARRDRGGSGECAGECVVAGLTRSCVPEPTVSPIDADGRVTPAMTGVDTVVTV